MLFQPIFRPEHISQQWSSLEVSVKKMMHSLSSYLWRESQSFGTSKFIGPKNLGQKIWSFGGFRVLGSMSASINQSYEKTARERKILFEGLWKMHTTKPTPWKQWKMKMFIWSSWPPGLESWEIHFNGYFKTNSSASAKERAKMVSKKTSAQQDYHRGALIVYVDKCLSLHVSQELIRSVSPLGVLQWVFVVLQTCVIPNAPPLKAYHYIPPHKITWNPKMGVWKMMFLFKQVIFRFHVCFQGCITVYIYISL